VRAARACGLSIPACLPDVPPIALPHATYPLLSPMQLAHCSPPCNLPPCNLPIALPHATCCPTRFRASGRLAAVEQQQQERQQQQQQASRLAGGRTMRSSIPAPAPPKQQQQQQKQGQGQKRRARGSSSGGGGSSSSASGSSGSSSAGSSSEEEEEEAPLVRVLSPAQVRPHCTCHPNLGTPALGAGRCEHGWGLTEPCLGPTRTAPGAVLVLLKPSPCVATPTHKDE